jgi:hypothetical protein
LELLEQEAAVEAGAVVQETLTLEETVKALMVAQAVLVTL